VSLDELLDQVNRPHIKKCVMHIHRSERNGTDRSLAGFC
jgi:hypothetical protein